MVRSSCRDRDVGLLHGFTLIELLVIISVIGLVVALLLPAVQQAREAARRVTCGSNMKNIGMAIHNHADAHNTFPAGIVPRPYGASYLFQMLPYMEETSFYNTINISYDMADNANSTANSYIPKLLLCPSDNARSVPESEKAANYCGNAGHSVVNGEGVFIGRALASRDIPDGLSQTVGVAEWIVGPGTRERASRLGSIYMLKQVYNDADGDLEAFTRTCKALSPSDIRHFGAFKGWLWLEANMGNCQYNHQLTPNLPSCLASQDMNATTAGSFHRGGAQVLTMDGAIHFVKDSINPRIWTALGTRSGGEVVENSPY